MAELTLLSIANQGSEAGGGFFVTFLSMQKSKR